MNPKRENAAMNESELPRDLRGRRLSIVVTVYNESEAISRFFPRLIPVVESITSDYEVICVNDGSSDDSLECLEAIRRDIDNIVILDLSRNFGKEAALTAGLDWVTGDAVIPLDIDLQDPPELIPRLVDKWLEGYDVVVAVRADRTSETWLKRHTAKLFYRIFAGVSDVDVPVDAGDFRLMDRRVVQALRQLPERTRFMKGLFAWLGFRRASVPYTREARSAGQSKWSFWRLWNFALEGILSFTTLPLRIWTYLGIVLAAFAAIYIGIIVVRVLIFGVDVPGYASLIVVVLFFSGINMVGLGIIGEYLGRVFSEVKRRPIYLIRDVIGADEREPEANAGSIHRRGKSSPAGKSQRSA
jgi:glycosyltransferase involved in cell wall biosynthesis